MQLKREINIGAARGLENLIKSVSNKVAKVGWTQGQKYPADDKGNTPLVAAIAYLMENGGIGADGNRIPARPFLSMTIRTNFKYWLTVMERGAQAVLEEESTFDAVLTIVGNKAVDDIRKTVQNFVPPRLSDYTIQRRREKYHDKKTIGNLYLPLIDTGVMLATLNNVVEPE